MSTRLYLFESSFELASFLDNCTYGRLCNLRCCYQSFLICSSERRDNLMLPWWFIQSKPNSILPSAVVWLRKLRHTFTQISQNESSMSCLFKFEMLFKLIVLLKINLYKILLTFNGSQVTGARWNVTKPAHAARFQKFIHVRSIRNIVTCNIVLFNLLF